jgi:hypothetical protein
MAVVWIVEMERKGVWIPISGFATTHKLARMRIKKELEFGPKMNYRVRKYVRVEPSK